DRQSRTRPLERPGAAPPRSGGPPPTARGKPPPPTAKETPTKGPRDAPDTPYFRGPAGAPHFVPNLWPERPAELPSVWRAYYRELERLAGDIMRIFALALDLPEHFFADQIDKHVSPMRAVNYPDPPKAP